MSFRALTPKDIALKPEDLDVKMEPAPAPEHGPMTGLIDALSELSPATNPELYDLSEGALAFAANLEMDHSAISAVMTVEVLREDQGREVNGKWKPGPITEELLRTLIQKTREDDKDSNPSVEKKILEEYLARDFGRKESGELALTKELAKVWKEYSDGIQDSQSSHQEEDPYAAVRSAAQVKEIDTESLEARHQALREKLVEEEGKTP